VCHVWMFTEPLAPGSGWRDVRVSDRRTAVDWAHQVKALVDDPRYADADWITLVCDQLNTHVPGSLYKAFTAEEAYASPTGSNLFTRPNTARPRGWLNIAECELSVLTRQCLDRRIPGVKTIDDEARAWSTARNATQTGVDWRFTTDQARNKLKRLYPKVVG
jgi:hypothetical protein